MNIWTSLMVILNRYIKSELQGNYSSNVQLDLTVHLFRVIIDSKEELGDVLTCIMIINLSRISLGMPVITQRVWEEIKTAKLFISLSEQAEWWMETQTLEWKGKRCRLRWRMRFCHRSLIAGVSFQFASNNKRGMTALQYVCDFLWTWITSCSIRIFNLHSL